jgi:hypothetical protein
MQYAARTASAYQCPLVSRRLEDAAVLPAGHTSTHQHTPDQLPQTLPRPTSYVAATRYNLSAALT